VKYCFGDAVGEHLGTRVPDTRLRAGSVCWECEALSVSLVEVALQSTSGEAYLLRLCRACYRGYYIPLLVKMAAGEGAQPEARPAHV